MLPQRTPAFTYLPITRIQNGAAPVKTTPAIGVRQSIVSSGANTRPLRKPAAIHCRSPGPSTVSQAKAASVSNIADSTASFSSRIRRRLHGWDRSSVSVRSVYSWPID